MNSAQSIQFVTITPETATQWLAKNVKHNRAIKQYAVTRYCDLICAGQWQPAAGIIHIATDGTLINGQHRLAAVIQAKMPINQLVCFNTDAAAYDHIDQGSARTPKDVLTSHGYRNATKLAAIAVLLTQLESGHVTAKCAVGSTEVLAVIAANDSAIQFSLTYPDHLDVGGVKVRSGGAAIRAAFAFAVRYYPRELVSMFIDSIVAGRCEKGDSIWALRSIIQTAAVNQSARLELAKKALLAVDAFATGKTRSMLRPETADAHLKSLALRARVDVIARKAG